MNFEKLLIGTALGVLMFGSLAVSAFAAAPVWNVAGTWGINVTLDTVSYPESLVLTQDGTNITGGSINTVSPNDASAFTIKSGSINGNNIDLNLSYNPNPAMFVHMWGIIDPNGAMSGSWKDQPGFMERSGTWSSTTGKAIRTGGPKDKDQCKKDGWKDFKNFSFANQGRCEKYAKGRKEKEEVKANIYKVTSCTSDIVSSDPYKGHVILTSPEGKYDLSIKGEIQGLFPKKEYFVWARNLDANGGYKGSSLLSYKSLGYYELTSFVTNNRGDGEFQYRIKESDLPFGSYPIQVAINQATSGQIGCTVAATTSEFLTVDVGD